MSRRESCRSKPIERCIFTDGSNGIVRLPPLIWRAFYEAALYLEIDSVQECFICFLAHNGILSKHTNFVQIVELLEMYPQSLENLKFNRKGADL